ncbi:putative amidohydrolase/GNAT superfamily N-acetyltransferase [Salirhabdus euzebyi]|uniref:Putative amidohydrolase/GNAT superfamily N-acetyltransferase n=1 Tax=Salirhabdus euzebyi TaxID=394506 RepID=A0A841Q8J0_9BACI|nr:GNAT family N-acetyltransferase [Salirhabdus euzebyi]MBB6454720.1 putative amidohydrolase/GNAT superfamily N-acetyltransferase [Salirhabdus euzebyi]
MVEKNKEIDSNQLGKEIIVRNTRYDDIDEIIAMAHLGFGDPAIAFNRKQYETHLQIFPEGQICVEYKGKIIGSCSSLIINFEDYGENHTIGEISGGGYIRNHNPEGVNLYGIDVVVHPEYRDMKIGRRLYEARRELCKRFNLKSIIFGGRIPNYHKYADKLTAEEYVEEVIQKKIYDPVLTFQIMNGFELRKVMSNYLKEDKESLEYATLMEWVNVDYRPDSDHHYRRSLPVRISVIQYMLREIEEFDDFAAQVEYFIESSSNIRSDFAVFPESITLQLLSFIDETVPSKQVRKLAEYTDQYLKLFTDLAIRYNINIIGGSHFVEEDNSIYNVSFLFRRDGTIEKQYQIHISSDEKKWWGIQPGRTVQVFDTDCGKISILLGYDIQFAELSRIAVDKGAQIIFTPFSAEDEQGYLRVRYCSQARAVENEVYTVMSGTVGHLPYVYHMDVQYAQSGIFSPCDFNFPSRGIISECGANIETMVIGEIDLEVLRRYRKVGTVTHLKDRRDDVYRVQLIEPTSSDLETSR